ncbi:hypothetical protein [Streptococcus sp. DD04]|uniref:hypothetical protein n=1 Tax=Streptococcus sp. DD04 TaxID=1776578 RepID=UPI00079798CF|nr:hypothetical protein [Streptococcus sp. DD04]KXT64780.1 hypothetical protein STRDD04_01120 [Streptococcus sp. DD04]
MKNQDSLVPSVVIKEMTFNDGSKKEFNKDDIVLLVGPNNVGKSRTLKDLREDLNDKSESKLLVKEVKYETTGFSEEQLRDYFERNIAKTSYGDYCVWIDENSSHIFNEQSFTNIWD